MINFGRIFRYVAEHALMGVAWVLAAIGIAGIFLPLIPGVLFLIAAALCAAKSCPALQQRIFALPKIGSDIEAFVRNGTMRGPSKRAAIGGMTVAGIVVAVAFGPVSTLGVSALLGLGFGAAYVATRPTPAVFAANSGRDNQTE